jgi:hypothetical protein
LGHKYGLKSRHWAALPLGQEKINSRWAINTKWKHKEQKMAECKVCQKELNQEASEIGSWCIDCIKSMSGTNTGNMGATRDMIKKEKILILILSAIGAVGGIILGASNGMAAETIGIIIVCIWAIGGFGAGLAFFISIFAFQYKMERASGNDFEGALKQVFQTGLIFLVLGILGGPITFLVLVLRRNGWIKKFDAIIASEYAAIAELEGYTLGKDVNKSDLSRKLGIIAGNFELAHDGVSLYTLKQLKMVQ